MDAEAEGSGPPGVMRSEMALWVGALTSALLLFFGGSWLGDLSNFVRSRGYQALVLPLTMIPIALLSKSMAGAG